MSSTNVLKKISELIIEHLVQGRRECSFDGSRANLPLRRYKPKEEISLINYISNDNKQAKMFFSSVDLRKKLTSFKEKDFDEERYKEILKKLEHYIIRNTRKKRQAEIVEYNKRPPWNRYWYINNCHTFAAFHLMLKYCDYKKRTIKNKRTIYNRFDSSIIKGVDYSIMSCAKNKKLLKKRITGHPPVLRMTPNPVASRGEAERIVNLAARLLLVTEKYDRNAYSYTAPLIKSVYKPKKNPKKQTFEIGEERLSHQSKADSHKDFGRESTMEKSSIHSGRSSFMGSDNTDIDPNTPKTSAFKIRKQSSKEFQPEINSTNELKEMDEEVIEIESKNSLILTPESNPIQSRESSDLEEEPLVEKLLEEPINQPVTESKKSKKNNLCCKTSTEPDQNRSTEPDQNRSTEPDQNRSTEPDQNRSTEPDQNRTKEDSLIKQEKVQEPPVPVVSSKKSETSVVSPFIIPTPSQKDEIEADSVIYVEAKEPVKESDPNPENQRNSTRIPSILEPNNHDQDSNVVRRESQPKKLSITLINNPFANREHDTIIDNDSHRLPPVEDWMESHKDKTLDNRYNRLKQPICNLTVKNSSDTNSNVYRSNEIIPLKQNTNNNNFITNNKQHRYFRKQVSINLQQNQPFRNNSPVERKSIKQNLLVKVITGNRLGASTNADVYLFIEGSNDRLPRAVHLAKSRNNIQPFRRGRTDVFRIASSRDLGYIQSIQIGHDSNLPGSDWYLQSVNIIDENRQLFYEFQANRWLSVRAQDGRTRINLEPYNSARQSGSLSKWTMDSQNSTGNHNKQLCEVAVQCSTEDFRDVIIWDGNNKMQLLADRCDMPETKKQEESKDNFDNIWSDLMVEFSHVSTSEGARSTFASSIDSFQQESDYTMATDAQHDYQLSNKHRGLKEQQIEKQEEKGTNNNWYFIQGYSDSMDIESERDFSNQNNQFSTSKLKQSDYSNIIINGRLSINENFSECSKSVNSGKTVEFSK